MSTIASHILILSSISLGLVLLYIYQYRKLRNKYSNTKLNSTVEENELLDILINNMPDRIYFKDLESKFIFANKHVSMIMGEKDPGKLVGKSDFDFYDDHLARPYYDDEQRIMKEGKPMIGKEEKGLDLDGNEIYVSTTKIPIRDSKKKIIGIIGIGRDITPQKEAENMLHDKTENLKETNVLLEERQEEVQQMAEELNAQAENLKIINVELERLSLVASKTENTVVIMDGNGNFEWVNAAFEERYGMNLERFIAENGLNLRENSSNENISAVLNQIYLTQKPYTYNSKFISKDGNEYWSQSNITPILNSKNEIVNLVLIDSDITELKLADSRIKKQNKEIKAKSQELKETNATKDRLFSIIAHDLKNPFHSILGFTEILQKKYKDVEREKLKEMLEMIGVSTRSAYQLLENLLDWARTQSGNISFKPAMVNLKEIVEESASLLSLQASNKKITFNYEIENSIEAYADRNMLTTVIRNLASNAIKYSSENGSVIFNCTSDGITSTIEVIDSGIGISEEKIKDLFQLDKVKSTAGTAGESGTGLGLIVCEEFIRMNKGSISASSIQGKGSTFAVTLPASDS
jgi:PAS domain S-box-containing protein